MADKQTSTSEGHIPENPFNKEIDDYVAESMEEWKLPGLSVAVVDGDETYTKGYGHATLQDTPATPSTLWYAASTTKAFTAALLAHMIDSKAYPLLSNGWQTTISSIIREDFVLQDPWATQNLTLEDAASHRTGLPRHDKAGLQTHPDGRPSTVRDIVRNLRNLPFAAPPRTKFMYNNFMYVVLGHVIETLRGQTLEEALREVIWKPLGMNDTFFSLHTAKASKGHFATCYFYDEAAKEHKVVPHMTVEEDGGAGAIITTAEDFAKWTRCLLRQTEPFSKAAHEDIRKPRIIASMLTGLFDADLYGLGWHRNSYRGTVYYKHDGGMHAAGSTVLWVPSLDFGVTAFGNTPITSNAVIDSLVWKLLDERLGVPLAEQIPAGAKKWKDFLAKAKENVAGAVKEMFPNLPDPCHPPTITADEAAGTYHDEGYKTLKLEAAPHPEKDGEQVLIAKRDDMTWHDFMEFQHVSGDYWIVWSHLWNITTPHFRDYLKARFNRGADGKVSSVEIFLEVFLPDQSEVSICYKRVS